MRVGAGVHACWQQADVRGGLSEAGCEASWVMGGMWVARWPTRRWSDAWKALMELQQDSVIFTHFMLINALVSRATSNEKLVCFEPDYGSITQLRISSTGNCDVVSLGKQLARLP